MGDQDGEKEKILMGESVQSEGRQEEKGREERVSMTSDKAWSWLLN